MCHINEWEFNKTTDFNMQISEGLLKILSKPFAPASTSTLRYKQLDVMVVADKNGNAVQAFIGKKNNENKIKGERFARIFIKDKEGKLIKDHWDKKGKSK